MNSNRELWEKGYFARIAATTRAGGETLGTQIAANFPLVNVTRTYP